MKIWKCRKCSKKVRRLNSYSRVCFYRADGDVEQGFIVCAACEKLMIDFLIGESK